jgi:prepilin-type N-terminal cleavage/methylation domain-containing protein
MNNTTAAGRRAQQYRGFSLVELLVASAVFLLIAGAAFALFQKQQTSSQIVQGQVGLNLALRNAATQLQIDLANAGSYYYQADSANVPGWPIGVSIINNVPTSGTSCYTASTNTYGPNCFDQLNIIAAADPGSPSNPADPNAFPAIHATSSGGGNDPSTDCFTTSTDAGGGFANAYGQAAPGLNLSQTMSKFKQNDQLLFVDSTGNYVTSVILTQDAAVAGSAVKFVFRKTNTDGSNLYDSTNPTKYDRLHITDCMGQVSPCTIDNKLQSQFCANDWILKLAPITYQVDTSNSSNPTLTRMVGNGTPVTVMEQVIGFKVGAAIWNAAVGTDTDDTTCSPSSALVCPFNYDAKTYWNTATGWPTTPDMRYNYSLVRAVRVSLIGRTAPNNDPNYKFRNAFDNGPYQVQGTAVVVNPRDLSMNDYQSDE